MCCLYIKTCDLNVLPRYNCDTPPQPPDSRQLHPLSKCKGTVEVRPYTSNTSYLPRNGLDKFKTEWFALLRVVFRMGLQDEFVSPQSIRRIIQKRRGEKTFLF